MVTPILSPRRAAPFRPSPSTLAAAVSLALLSLSSGLAQAQQAPGASDAPATVTVTGHKAEDATRPSYQASDALMGPLGKQDVMDTPASVSAIPEELMANQQTRTVNDTLRFLPSVQIRNQQGFEVSRPQARGFQSSIVQNTRLDGLSTIATTAIATENLSQIQVLNGLSGALYGPSSPAGVFNYVLKRPTDQNLLRFVEGYDEKGVWTEQVEAGGHVGPNGIIGYRVNAVHGQGESWVAGSNTDRNLVSGDFDVRIDPQTRVEADFSHYRTAATGLPGSIVYDTNKGANTSNVLPGAIDPTRVGYGQPNAGTDLKTDTGMLKIRHAFSEHWSLEVGGLYQDALRIQTGISNTLIDNKGDYTVTKNFTSIPHFTIASNLLYLHGQFDTAGMRNDLTLGTNGFINNQYNYRNSIIVSNPTVVNLADPQTLTFAPTPANGGEYKVARVTEQSLMLGDTLHINSQWALQAVVSRSDIESKSYDKTGKVSSDNESNGEYSPTVSLIYKPTAQLSTYVTAARSVEQGEQAPAGTVNANQFLALYRDKQVEGGVKYALDNGLLLTVAAFHMTRPLATTDAATNVFAVAGTQTNNGAEFFAQGNLRPDLSLFGGVTYIDAKLDGTTNPATNDKRVVGVPRFKSDFVLDYHPDFARGFSVNGVLHTESSRAATNTNNSFAPSYATFDAGVRYATSLLEHHQAVLRLQVQNIGDKRYYASIADGNIVGSPGANTAYVGTPRSVMASLELTY